MGYSGVISIRLEKELEERLEALAELTHRTKAFYIREAMEKHLGDLERKFLTEEQLEISKQRTTKKEG